MARRSASCKPSRAAPPASGNFRMSPDRGYGFLTSDRAGDDSGPVERERRFSLAHAWVQIGIPAQDIRAPIFDGFPRKSTDFRNMPSQNLPAILKTI